MEAVEPIGGRKRASEALPVENAKKRPSEFVASLMESTEGNTGMSNSIIYPSMSY